LPEVAHPFFVPIRGSFAPDGTHLVWGAADGIARVFRIADSGEPSRGKPAEDDDQ
jgi:hypothetical protein